MGNQLSIEPNDSHIQGQPIRYAGYVYDIETKLYYLQARYYDPQTARFISRDPDPGDEDDPMTMNGYTYADDNPVMMTDPDGHFAHFIPVAVVGYKLYKGYNTYKKIKGLKKAGRAVKKKNNKPFVPAEYCSRKAPKISTPNTKIKHYRIYNGKKEKSTVVYDKYGRQRFRVDHSNHSMPKAHSTPHLHEYKYSRGNQSGRGYLYNLKRYKK